MLTLIFVVAAVVGFFYYYFIRPMSIWKRRGVTQGNPKWFFGHGFGPFTRTGSWAEMAQRVYNQSPGTRYTGLYFLPTPILMIKDPDLLKQMAIKDFEHFTDHIAFLPADSDPLWEKNLLSLQGRKWRDMRSLLSPVFTGSKMRLMFTLIEESVQNFIQYFLEKKDDVTVVEMKDIFARFATDVIATTACGIKVNSLAEPNNQFYLKGQEAIDFNSIWKNLTIALYGLIPAIKKIIKVQVFSDEVSTFFREMIYETIKVREEKGFLRLDLIHLLLEARKGIDKPEEVAEVDTGFATTHEYSSDLEKDSKKTLTNEDIAAQALVFFIAGFDSVSSLMCFTTYELAVNQDVQKRLREEVQSTSKKCGGKLTYEALLGMKYLDMVISESLRKWPNAIAVDRECTKPYTIEPQQPGEAPLQLKKKDFIWIPIFPIHRDPNNYPDPDRFDPERFSDENKANIKPYTYIPFGIGPRNCIGSRFALLEAKLVIFYILLHFELVPVEKTQIPLKISKKTFALNAEHGFWLGFKKIKND